MAFYCVIEVHAWLNLLSEIYRVNTIDSPVFLRDSHYTSLHPVLYQARLVQI